MFQETSLQFSLYNFQAKQINQLLPSGYKINQQDDQKFKTPIYQREKRQIQNLKYQDFVLEKRSPVKPQISSDFIKKCQKIIQKVKKHQYSYPFMVKVNEAQLGINDYYEKIKNPMDLTTLSENLTKGSYQNLEQFQNDFNLIFSNSFTYNDPNTYIYQMTEALKQYYLQVIEEVTQPQLHSIKQIPQKQQKKIECTKPITFAEKRQLGQNIRNLAPEKLLGVWSIVSDGSQLVEKDQSFEFDIDQLSYVKFRELENYVKNQIQEKQTPVQKQETIIQNSYQLENAKTCVDNDLYEQSSISSFISDSDESQA